MHTPEPLTRSEPSVLMTTHMRDFLPQMTISEMVGATYTSRNSNLTTPDIDFSDASARKSGGELFADLAIPILDGVTANRPWSAARNKAPRGPELFRGLVLCFRI